MLVSQNLFGQSANGQQNVVELDGEGMSRGVGVVALVVLVMVGGKETRGQRSAACSQQLS